MKILFYYPGQLRNRRRGTPLRVYAIYKSLRKLADIYLVARELPEDARECSMALEPPRKGLDWLLQTRVLRRAAREFRPDLFYGHTHLAMLPLLLAAGRHAKTCVDLHSLYHHELGLQGVHKWATAGWHRILTKRLTGITAVCDPLTRFYRGDAASGFTFHGGVDGQAMEAVTPAAIDKSAGPVITYCGNARRYQGIDVLLAALAKIRKEPWQLLLVLSSREAEVRRLLEIHGLTGRAAIKQDLDQIEVFAHLKAADIAVVPRPDIPITRYALPSKLPEYLASGTAVVATEVGDAYRLVSDRETGWLVPPGNAEALATTLKHALHSAHERDQYGKRARERMCAEFDWDVLTERAFGFLQTL